MISHVSGYPRGPVNIEARVTEEGAIYMIEVTPRSGGNHVPIIIQHLTGFDFVRQSYCDATGSKDPLVLPNGSALPGAHYVLHSSVAGTLKGVTLSDAIKPHLLHLELFKRDGERVQMFRGSGESIGVALLSFTSVDERDAFMIAANQHIIVHVDQSRGGDQDMYANA